MTQSLKLASISYLAICLAGSPANAQQAQPPNAAGIQAPVVGEQGIGEIDDSLILPFDLGIPEANGLTDRFGMPLVGPFVKSDQGVQSDETPDSGQEKPKSANTKRTPAKRSSSSIKGSLSKAKDTKRSPSRAANTKSGEGPQYYIPHGSLEWTPGESMISTSPSNPFGYGHGSSGYGTEVFGDFWKGWPMVQ